MQSEPILPRRRLCDRLVEREKTENRALAPLHAHQVLLIDDDLRETALSITALEKYLAQVLRTLESEQVTAAELLALAHDSATAERIDTLVENLASIRRGLISVAAELSKH